MAAVLRLLLVLLFLLSLLTFVFSEPETEALLKLKKSFGPCPALVTWTPTSNACVDKWYGVICFNGAVIGLSLENMALSGTIDVDALRKMPGLRTLTFANNSFSGPIPEFYKLSALRALYLSRNKFSGEIPGDYFSLMTALRKLWLDHNQFTGKIPDSIMKLPTLAELHLEANKFSGPIPELKQPASITSIDLSYNDLENEIPKSLSEFRAETFLGNLKLCGKPLNQPCKKSKKPPPVLPKPSKQEKSNSSGGKSKSNHGLVIAASLIGFLLIFIAVAVFLAKRKERTYFSVLEKDHHDNRVVEVHLPEHYTNRNRKSTESSQNLTGKSSKTDRSTIAGLGDLVMINDENVSFGLTDLMRASAEVLGNGGMGSAYKAAMRNGLTVVVKRTKEMNKMGKDIFDAEMRRLGRLRHPNILTPLAYHFRREEKLVISEYMPKGSLLYLLHGDRGISHSELTWPIRLKIIKGITSGLGFIHSEFASYDLPHGNLKSSNVILNEHYEPLLNDYAFDPLTNPNHAAQTMFGYRSPEYTQYQKVSPKSDVYCLGIIILEIITGKFPSQSLSNGKGGIDVVERVRSVLDEGRETELIDPDIAGDINSIDNMVKLLQIGIACTESEPEQRLDMGEVTRRIEEVQV